MKESESLSVLSDSLRPNTLYSAWNSLGQTEELEQEWVAFPFSRGSPQPRDRTLVSHIVHGFFTSWATREAQFVFYGTTGVEGYIPLSIEPIRIHMTFFDQ